jgi:hypothetical protein
MNHWIQENVFLTVLLSFSVILSLRLFFGLWILPQHKKTRLVSRIFWSIIVMIPFFGPLIYGALYRLPNREFGAEENWPDGGGHF